MTAPSTPFDPTATRKAHALAYLILYSQEWEKDHTLTPEKFHVLLHEKHAANVTAAKAQFDAREAAKEKK